MKKTNINFIVICLSLVLLPGCDIEGLLNKILPEEDDMFAREYIQLVKEGNYQEAITLLDKQFVDDNTSSALKEITGYLNQSEIKNIEVVGVNIFYTAKKTQSKITYQLEFKEGWGLVDVIVDTIAGKKKIYRFHFNSIPESLKELNAFTLAGKSVIHYIILVLALFVPIFIVWSFVLCLKTKVRKKWLWGIFILLSFTKLDINWTTGQVGYVPLSFNLLGTAIFKDGLYAPWILSVGFPLGALLFVVFRRKLQAAAEQTVVKMKGPEIEG